MFLPRTRSARFPRRARARGPPRGWGSARRPSGACWRCPGRSTQQGTNSAFEGGQCNRQRPADESTQLGRRGAPSARGSSGRPWCQSSRSGLRKEPLATEGSPVRNETKLPQAAKAGSACPQSTWRLSGTVTTASPLQKGVSAREAVRRLPWTDELPSQAPLRLCLLTLARYLSLSAWPGVQARYIQGSLAGGHDSSFKSHFAPIHTTPTQPHGIPRPRRPPKALTIPIYGQVRTKTSRGLGRTDDATTEQGLSPSQKRRYDDGSVRATRARTRTRAAAAGRRGSG